ncbi:hypothetical protein JQ625_29845 [Bradyrhizobium diazoefficiens]|nr:hypothetical protein [Bradyrhizobium diazoefficiens]MBR0779044.1 hypothetical protein [Bradyrhizobium diazoefficiens]
MAAKRRINTIANSLDKRRLSLAASRKALQRLIESAQSNVTLDMDVSLAAAALDRQCCASMKEGIALYHVISENPYDLLSQARATANLINAQTRIAREHQLIVSITAPLLKAPDGMQVT